MLPLLQGIVAVLAEQHGDSLVGVYLRGSLPQGHYIEDMSDVDTFCIVVSDPTAPASLSSPEQHVRDTLLTLGHNPVVVSKVSCTEGLQHAVPAHARALFHAHTLPARYRAAWRGMPML